MSSGIVFHLLAAAAYAILAGSLWKPLWSSEAGQEASGVVAGKVRRVCLAGAIALHGAGLWQAILPGSHGIYLGWALAFSAAIWLGMVVFWLESFVMRIDGLLLILLPASAIASLITGLFPGGHLIHEAGDWLRLHLLIALMAYGLITVAALQAILMAALDRQLHRPVEPEATRSILGRALDSMPPLLVQEVLLFRLIWFGFAILTLTVITGAVVSLRLSGQLLPMDHKTLFTLLSWFTFGGLLLGRYTRGWRGRIALRWTLVGFAFLLLSYSGSRFVIDVILARG
jgi:ABC-type uncharacterized transport system permease subunit